MTRRRVKGKKRRGRDRGGAEGRREESESSVSADLTPDTPTPLCAKHAGKK